MGHQTHSGRSSDPMWAPLGPRKPGPAAPDADPGAVEAR